MTTKKKATLTDPTKHPAVIAWRRARDEHAALDAEHRAARERAEAKGGPYRSAPLDMQLATLRAERAKLEASSALAEAQYEASLAIDALEVETAGAPAFEVDQTRSELRAMLDKAAVIEAQLREQRDRIARRVTATAAAWTALAQTTAEQRQAADLPPATFIPPAFFALKSMPYGEYGKHQKVVEFALADGAPALTPPDHSTRLMQIRYEEDKLLAEMERQRLEEERQRELEADYRRREADAEKARAARAAEETARLRAERAAEAALADAARERTEPYKAPKVTYDRAPKAPSGARI